MRSQLGASGCWFPCTGVRRGRSPRALGAGVGPAWRSSCMRTLPAASIWGLGLEHRAGRGPQPLPVGSAPTEAASTGGPRCPPSSSASVSWPQQQPLAAAPWRPSPSRSRRPVPVPALGCCCPVRGGHSLVGGRAPEPWASLLTLVTRAPRCPASPAWLCTAPLPTRSRASVRSQLCAVFVGGCARSLRVASGPGQEAPGSSGGRPAECPPVRSRGRGSTAVGGQGCPCRHRGWGLASRR